MKRLDSVTVGVNSYSALSMAIDKCYANATLTQFLIIRPLLFKEIYVRRI